MQTITNLRLIITNQKDQISDLQDIDLLIQEEAPEAYAKSKENPNGK